MLEVKLTIMATSGTTTILDGDIGNISKLAAFSSYESSLDGRATVILPDYPRWCEPVRGLLARCIALSEPASHLVPTDWHSIRIDIGLNGGGRARHTTRIAMVRMELLAGVLSVGWKEGPLTGFLEVTPRLAYGDIWSLAQHALNVSVWIADEIPLVRPIVVPLYGDNSYMRTSDLPSPVREAFELRQRYSGRPHIHHVGDACWVWDWIDFLNGNRDWF